MKNVLRFLPLFFLSFAMVILQGCLKDSARHTFTMYKPIVKSLTQVRADMKGGAPTSLESTGKLSLFGNYIFLNEVGKGIHVIDNSNPASPQNISFITIPNNVDIAIKGNYLYADSYSDLIVFDISNPTNAQPVKFMNNVMKEKNAYWYPNSTNPDSIQVVVGYTTKDTTVESEVYNRWKSYDAMALNSGSLTTAYTAAPQTSTGGSMASFTIISNHLYTVGSSNLYALDISTPQNPQQTAVKNLGWGIETIYPFQNKLFIGSRTGMFIYDLSNPANPTAQGQFTHANSCDPAIADGQYAYVTLRGGTACNSFTNELNIIDISNLSSPVLKARHTLTNPHGLAKDGNVLLICDGKEGLRIYDASSPLSLNAVKQISGIETYDVIARNKKAIVVAKDGLYQYDYTNAANPSLLSKISVNKK